MEKTFYYVDEYQEKEFEYTVYENKLLDAVVDLVFEDYFTKSILYGNCDYGKAVRKGIEDFITTYDLLEQLVEDYEYELKEYFEEDAFEEYDDYKRGRC